MTKATYTGPAHPIGYIELQSSWVGSKPESDLINEIDAIRAKGLAEHPGLVQWGARLETTVDGAGVAHCTLYMGFAPAQPSSEPLNPHNMNDAPLPSTGWPEPTDGILPLGSKERKF